jgi:hypothetical protein
MRKAHEGESKDMDEERAPAFWRLISRPSFSGGRHRRLRHGLVLTAALALGAASPAAAAQAASAQAATVSAAGQAAAARPAARPLLPGQAGFGPNVYVFSPAMPQSQIQATVDSIAAQQVPDQFGTQRYALLFEPGSYGSAADPLTFQVGYYTEVAGLGRSPGDVTVNGSIDVYNQCFTPTNCVALDNFWRSLSNLTINVTGQTGCQTGTDFWAVSQAAPMRRVNITGGNRELPVADWPGHPSGPPELGILITRR